MAASNNQLHTIAAIGTAVLAVGLAAPTVWFTSRAEASAGPALDDMTAIEASIAYKKPQPPKQPQKKTSQPDVVKPEGVSRDENKKPLDEPKKDDPPKKETPKDLSKQFQHPTDDDNEPGKPVDQIGDFNGQEYGWAEETKGDPYFQALAKDVHEGWEYPAILKGNGAKASGCLHIAADGKIVETTLHPKSGDETVDDAMERALEHAKKLRDDNPQPVPTYLLKAANKWVCFNFNI